MTTTLDGITLKHGGHHIPEAGMCLLEATAYLAGEPHSDHPKCVATSLTRFGTELNDSLDDEERQQLIPLIPRLIGTATDGISSHQRYAWCVDWLIRTSLPAWLDLAGLAASAALLRDLPTITTYPGGLGAATPAIEAARADVLAATRGYLFPHHASANDGWVTSAVVAADYNSIAYHADDTVRTGYGIAYSPRADPLGSARDTARTAAWLVAERAARAGADPGEALDLTVAALRASSIDLFARMIDGRPAAG